VADKCFTAGELACYKETFEALSEGDTDLKLWSESALTKFLELPEALRCGKVVYDMCSKLGAFPFSTQAPATLNGEALLRVVFLMTGRHMRILRGTNETWRKEIWQACAVLDPEASGNEDVTDPEQAPSGENENTATEASTTRASPVGKSHNVKEPPQNDDSAENDLAFYAFELVGALEDMKDMGKLEVEHTTIPRDNFRKLLELLLLTAPLEHGQNVSLYTANLDESRLEGLRTVASCILASFGVDQRSGIGYSAFDMAITNALPHLFESFSPWFEHFLSPLDPDLREPKSTALNGSSQSAPPTASTATSSTAVGALGDSMHQLALDPLLPVKGEILDLNLLSQLSFIFSSEKISHRLTPLYLGSNHGFSMGSFEKSVFSWQKPSILLISGTLLSPTTRQSHARTFLDDLPHRRLSSSLPSRVSPSSTDEKTPDSQRIIYGAYVPVPWKATENATFGNDQTTLFQLSPYHDVFPASFSGQSFIYFNKPPSTYPGLGFGSPLPNYNSMTTSKQSIGEPTRRVSVSTYSASDVAYTSSSVAGNSFSGPSSLSLTRRSSLLGDEHIPLGPVSLHIDDALQFGAFTHLAAAGASFEHSKLPANARVGEWQDRFEIDAIEVWGVRDASI
jgi:hypothetical protein